MLHEAEDERNPLLERLKILSPSPHPTSTSSHGSVIGGLKQQVVAGMQELTVDGRTPQQQIAECYGGRARAGAAPARVGPADLAQLEQYGIRLRPYSSLTADERKTIREYYYKTFSRW